MKTETLILALYLAAGGQVFIACLGPMIPRLLNWREAIANMPLLVREVFHVHTFFIALTCAIFGIITWRFAADIAAPAHELIRWFSFSVGLFWGFRSVMQWTVYSSSHWRGNARLTIIHWTLFLGYGAFAAAYFLAALG